MTTVIASLTPDVRQDGCIKHALAVRSAWALNNYHCFFKLYTNAPKMSGYLMDWFAEKSRKNALKAILKSYVLCAIVVKCDSRFRLFLLYLGEKSFCLVSDVVVCIFVPYSSILSYSSSPVLVVCYSEVCVFVCVCVFFLSVCLCVYVREKEREMEKREINQKVSVICFNKCQELLVWLKDVCALTTASSVLQAKMVSMNKYRV